MIKNSFISILTMNDGLLDSSKKSKRSSNDLFSALANFDLFNKVDDEFRVKTSSGALCIA